MVKDAEPQKPKIVTVKEVDNQFSGQRVVMRVAEFDDNGFPVAGEVLAHSLDPADITRKLYQLPKAEEGHPYYVFNAGHHPIENLLTWGESTT